MWIKCAYWKEIHNNLTTTQEYLQMSKKPNGINIQLTPCQFDYLYDVLMDAYANDIAEQKDWDVQTFDNLIDNVCNGTSTYLTSDVKGILHWPLN